MTNQIWASVFHLTDLLPWEQIGKSPLVFRACRDTLVPWRRGSVGVAREPANYGTLPPNQVWETAKEIHDIVYSQCRMWWCNDDITCLWWHHKLWHNDYTISAHQLMAGNILCDVGQSDEGIGQVLVRRVATSLREERESFDIRQLILHLWVCAGDS